MEGVKLKKMKKLALIIIALFTTTIVDANTYYSIANWKSNQNPNGKWSTSPNGASCNCGPNFSTDTVYISNNVTLYNGVSVNTGAIIVENGGRLTIGDWGGSTDFGANAYVEIKDGGTASNTFLSIVNGTFEGDIEEKRRQLLDYCEKDTLAMVKILDKLLEI